MRRRHLEGDSQLTVDEIRAALAELPSWTGDRRALVRLLVRPPEDLSRGLARLARLGREAGRGPYVEQRGGNQAVLVVRTAAIHGVTAADVDLAHAIEDAIDDIDAGVAR